MGYYTHYELNAEYGHIMNGSGGVFMCARMPHGTAEDIERELKKMNVFDGFSVDTLISDETMYADSEWYDHRADMIAMSYKVHSVLFTLYGCGEDDDDRWIEYYYNGEFQFAPAQITYDNFSGYSMRFSDDKLAYSPNYRYSYE